jgi:hypothetical protein
LLDCRKQQLRVADRVAVDAVLRERALDHGHGGGRILHHEHAVGFLFLRLQQVEHPAEHGDGFLLGLDGGIGPGAQQRHGDFQRRRHRQAEQLAGRMLAAQRWTSCSSAAA